MNNDAKSRKWGGLGWLGVTQGHRQCHHSVEHIELPIQLSRNCVCLVPFSRYSELFAKSRRILPTQSAFDAPVGVDPVVEFCGDHWLQKTKSFWAIVWHCYNVLRLAILAELCLVTERQTDTQRHHMPCDQSSRYKI